MNKFSLIRENYNLGSFSISRSQFNTYKGFIDTVLRGMYGDTILIPGFGEFIKPRSFESNEGRHISILNKVNTNLSVLSYLVREFKLSNFNEVIELIKTNSKELFLENSKYLPKIVEIIKATEKAGDKNEDLAISYIKEIIMLKKDINVTPNKVPTSSYKDLVLGIDVEFDINGKTYTCQVKPLVNHTYQDQLVLITTSGNVKHYNTDYICFSNWRSGSSILFQNKEAKKENYNLVSIPKKYLITK